MSQIKSTDEFEKIISQKDKVILVDMAATWCGPCQMMLPIIEEIEEEYKSDSKVQIIKIDIDDTPEIAAKYSVMSVPTFLFIKNEKPIHSIIGATAKDIITEKIEELKK